jgi:response regulator of citrate/malate metabolism
MDKEKVLFFVTSDKEIESILKDLNQINKNLKINTHRNLKNIEELIKHESPQIIIVDTNIMEKHGKEILPGKINNQYKIILHSLGNYYEVKGNSKNDVGYILNLIEENQLKTFFQ